MRTDRCWILILFVMCALIPVLALSQTRPVHPLDALTMQEYWTVYDVLQASGRMDKDTVYATVLFHNPAKGKVLAWRAGDPMPREADAILFRKGQVIEARVDIAARKLESWNEPNGVHAPILDSEFKELGELVKKDPRVVGALAKRGIKDLTTVECVPLPFGYFAIP
jgi:primary-amine oxidase